MIRLPNWSKQALRFGTVGGLAFVLDGGVLWLLIEAGASAYAARVLSIAIAIVVTWTLNRSLTFRTVTPPSWREFAAYGVQSLAGALINYAIYSAVLLAGYPIPAALVLGVGTSSVFNFFGYRRLLG